MITFSDVPLSPKPVDGDNNWYTVDVPSRLKFVQPKMKIDEHCWEVLNNQD